MTDALKIMPYSFPSFALKEVNLDPQTAAALQQLVNDLKTYLQTVASVVNQNTRIVGRFGSMFFVWPYSPATTSVQVDEGFVWSSPTLTPVAKQIIGPITLPSGNSRIDRIVIDNSTGVASHLTGTESSSPSPPAIPSGKSPCCQIMLTLGHPTIDWSDLTDERAFGSLGV